MKKNFSKISAFVNGTALMLGTALSVVTLTGCTTDPEEVMNLNDQEQLPTAPVHIQVSNFTMSIDDIPDSQTRGDDEVPSPNPAENKTVGELTLAFYNGSTEVLKQTQVKSDHTTYETFGAFTCNLQAGTYTMVVIGRSTVANDVFSLTSPTVAAYSSEYARETYCATQSVTVTTTAALNLSVTLERIVTLLAIYSTDNRPSNATQIRTIWSAGGKGFNPTTGYATVNTGFTVVAHPSTNVGATIAIGSFAFLTEDEQSINITIEVLDDNDNVLFRKSLSNVPFRRNRQTTLSGALFSPSATSASFTLQTDWLDPITVNY